MGDLVNKLIKVKGMVCDSCERKITNKLSRLGGVKSVKANFHTSTVAVTFDRRDADLNSIYRAIENIGYKVEKTIVKAEKESRTLGWIKIFVFIGAAFIVLMTLQKTLGFSGIPQIGKNASYGLLFVTGLFASFHCIAMCGGISLSQGMGGVREESNKVSERLKPSLLYNSGRVVSYTIIGGILGLIGTAVSINNNLRSFVVIAAGIFMVIMGASNIIPSLRKYNIRLPKFITHNVHKSTSKAKGKPFLVGLLNGFMPCGPLQAIQLYALSTGNFTAGALSMFVFSLGTVPLMTGIGSIGTFFGKETSQKVFKASSVLVVILGLVMLNRGVTMAGFGFGTVPNNSGSQAAVVEDTANNVQVVRIKLLDDRYEPSSFSIKAGVPVKWIIEAESINFCNGQILVPAYNIYKDLHEGENVIEFTPGNDSNIRFSCGMGMIRGSIQVVGGTAQNGKAPEVKSAAKAENKDAQTIKLTIDENGYSTYELSAKRGKPVRWVVTGDNPPGCISTLVIPELNKMQPIENGENVIDFDIPKDAKELTYTCPMGMLGGRITIED